MERGGALHGGEKRRVDIMFLYSEQNHSLVILII